MNLKSRVKKMESKSTEARGVDPGAIFVCSLAPNVDAEGSVMPRRPGDTEARTPAFAFILKGPRAGEQETSLDSESLDEFQKRVERIVEGEG